MRKSLFTTGSYTFCTSSVMQMIKDLNWCTLEQWCHPHAYMPYLTLRDEISENLAHLESIPVRFFKYNNIFRPSYNTFYEEIHHTLLCLSQASQIKIKASDSCGSIKVIFVKISPNFIKSHLKIYHISQTLVHSFM